MKVLFFGSVTFTSESNFEVQTELILKHLKKGDEVIFVCVDKDLFEFQISQDFPEKRFKARVGLKKFEKLLKSLSKKIKFKEYQDFIQHIDFPVFNNIEELKKYEYDGFSIGMTCASSLISDYRNHGLDTKDVFYSSLIQKMLKLGIKILNTMDIYYKKYKPELVYIFNGRGITTGPIVLYCKKNRVQFKSYELVYSTDKYDLIDNTIPHDISYRSKQIVDMWEDSFVIKKEKEQQAIRFFEANRKGIPIVGENFTQLQKVTNNIDLLDKDKEIITFFNSSIDEYASVPGWENYIFLFDDEVEAIKSICEYFKNDKKKQFALRVHPNLIGLKNLQTKRIEELKSVKNLIIFPAYSDVSSYQLLDISSKIVTFGSTIGIEATYFGKPSISIGLSFHIDLDVCYRPKNKQELFDLIDTPNLMAKPIENTYPYGYWITNMGVPFELRGEEFPENYFSLSKIQKIRYLLLRFFNKRVMKKIIHPIYRKKFFKSLIIK